MNDRQQSVSLLLYTVHFVQCTRLGLYMQHIECTVNDPSSKFNRKCHCIWTKMSLLVCVFCRTFTYSRSLSLNTLCRLARRRDAFECRRYGKVCQATTRDTSVLYRSRQPAAQRRPIPRPSPSNSPLPANPACLPVVRGPPCLAI